MREKTCDICGHVVNPENVVIHRIIPEEVARQARIFDFRTATLCTDCSNEIQTWYGKKVYSMSYKDGAKQFILRSPAQIAKEYEATYKAFVEYKKRERAKSQHLGH